MSDSAPFRHPLAGSKVTTCHGCGIRCAPKVKSYLLQAREWLALRRGRKESKKDDSAPTCGYSAPPSHIPSAKFCAAVDDLLDVLNGPLTDNKYLIHYCTGDRCCSARHYTDAGREIPFVGIEGMSQRQIAVQRVVCGGQIIAKQPLDPFGKLDC